MAGFGARQTALDNLGQRQRSGNWRGKPCGNDSLGNPSAGAFLTIKKQNISKITFFGLID